MRERRQMAVNRRKWDESVPLHVASRLYDVPSFLRGRSTLHPLEIRQLGAVRGRSLLHLQCHFGLDTLSWARLGAHVTGVDFSGPAVAAARNLSEASATPGTFVRSNVYDLLKRLHGRFDVVYTGKGALCWLPDMDRWARVVARFLRPGGRFYLLEDHPAADVYHNDTGVRRLTYRFPYFRREGIREEFDGTYATRTKMHERVSYSWMHPVSEVLNSLLQAGLEIRRIEEYPYTFWKRFPFMRKGRDGFWHLSQETQQVPLMWSVTAQRPLGSRRSRTSSVA